MISFQCTSATPSSPCQAARKSEPTLPWWKIFLKFAPTLPSHNSGLKKYRIKNHHIFGIARTSAFIWHIWIPLKNFCKRTRRVCVWVGLVHFGRYSQEVNEKSVKLAVWAVSSNFLHDFTLFVVDIHQIRLISLSRHFSDHFHFHPILEQKRVIDLIPCHIHDLSSKIVYQPFFCFPDGSFVLRILCKRFSIWRRPLSLQLFKQTFHRQPTGREWKRLFWSETASKPSYLRGCQRPPVWARQSPNVGFISIEKRKKTEKYLLQKQAWKSGRRCAKRRWTIESDQATVQIVNWLKRDLHHQPIKCGWDCLKQCLFILIPVLFVTDCFLWHPFHLFPVSCTFVSIITSERHSHILTSFFGISPQCVTPVCLLFKCVIKSLAWMDA